MKKLFIKMFLFTALVSNAQGIMVVNEIDTASPENFSTMVNHWMTAVKTGMEIDNMQSYVFAEQGSKKMQFLQWFDSKHAMVEQMDQQEASQEKIWAAFQEMDPLPDGAFEAFNEVTDFRESSVWEYMPELSSIAETWEPLSQEEKDANTYRRIQYISVSMNSDQDFEQWNKDINALDKKLGVSYHYAVFKSVFGAKDADYMIVCVDKSRFDYHKNWAERMNVRTQSEAFKTLVSENNLEKWSVVGEAHWDRVVELTF
ncbi:MAG: Uncharacterised protein [Formosa sp. Hel3_A1_48]|nr:MAG: Uncharacterised protein [Formosa sp. Hel3_A1_48]